MHTNLLNADDIDYNLYPALLQVFALILIGYLTACFELIDKNQALGLNKFVSTFALPALLFRNTAVLDFSSVNWLFLTSIFLSKTTVFVLAIVVTLLTLRPVNIGMAALFAIFVSQSNDFALGFPILQAVYSKTHPEYLHYIYLIAPISLCILNPIAFFMMEANEVLAQTRQNTRLTSHHYHHDVNSPVEKLTDDEEAADHLIGPDDNQSELERNSNTLNVDSCDLINADLDQIRSLEQTSSLIQASNSISSPDFSNLIEKEELSNRQKKKLSTCDLLKKTIWSTISNPIVFMTMIGLASSFILKRQIPSLIDPILLALSNTFSAIALFYLGFTMVGKIRNLQFSFIVIIMVLIFTKSVIYPLITREIVLHLNSGATAYNQTAEDVESLSTFGFLYGTFPTAPSLFFYLVRFKAIGDDLVSSALVFGTLASAPLMMISGKMIALKYNSSTAFNFEDIECKTASGFSILTWFCCIWVLYIFIASGRAFRRSHRLIFWLVVSQMLNALVHIIWSSVTSNLNDVSPVFGYLHVIFALFAAFSTQSWPLAIMLNVAAISGLDRFSNSRFLEFLVRMGKRRLVCYSIGFVFPLGATLLCALVGGIPENQTMMISVSKAQIIIGNVLLFLVIASIFVCLIVFSRAKNENNSFLTLLSNVHSGKQKNSGPCNHRKTYSLLSQDPCANEDAHRESHLDDAESGGPTLIPSDAEARRNSDEFKNLVQLNQDFQITKQIALVIILTFDCFLMFFFEMWVLFDEVKSGLFFELQLIQTTLLYGQGFLTFLVFGFDNEYIFSPLAFKIKELLGIIKPFQLKPLEEVSRETHEICRKFETNYKSKCIKAIVKNHRFHYSFYRSVFKSSDFVDWALRRGLVSQREQAVELGRMLISGRVIQHVCKNKDFHDGYHLYKFI